MKFNCCVCFIVTSAIDHLSVVSLHCLLSYLKSQFCFRHLTKIKIIQSAWSSKKYHGCAGLNNFLKWCSPCPPSTLLRHCRSLLFAQNYTGTFLTTPQNLKMSFPKLCRKGVFDQCSRYYTMTGYIQQVTVQPGQGARGAINNNLDTAHGRAGGLKIARYGRGPCLAVRSRRTDVAQRFFVWRLELLVDREDGRARVS